VEPATAAVVPCELALDKLRWCQSAGDAWIGIMCESEATGGISRPLLTAADEALEALEELCAARSSDISRLRRLTWAGSSC